MYSYDMQPLGETSHTVVMIHTKLWYKISVAHDQTTMDIRGAAILSDEDMEQFILPSQDSSISEGEEDEEEEMKMPAMMQNTESAIHS